MALLERSQLEEDVEGFLSLFDSEAVWVTGGGRRLIGKDSIRAFTKEVLPGAFADGSTVRYEIDHVLVVAHDVVVTCVNQQYYDPDGVASSAGLPTYLWRFHDGAWTIVSGQNTAVQAQG